MQDERRYLTDQPLYPKQEGLARTSADEFRRSWTTGPHRPASSRRGHDDAIATI
jgi:hypothetical protein